MDEIDFRDVEEVILVVDGEELIFRNPASFPELGRRLAALAPKKRAAARSRVVDDPPRAARKAPPREPEDDYLDEGDEEGEQADLYEAPKPKRKAKAKKSITHVPGGKSKMNLKVNVPSGNIRDVAERLKAQARASTKGEMFKD